MISTHPHQSPSSATSAAAAHAAATAPRCPFHRIFRSTTAMSAELKESTRPQHLKAEHHPLQQQAVRGTIDRRAYAALTAQLRHLHVALETSLDKAAVDEPRLGTVFAPHCRRIAAFDADLALLDSASEVRTPLSAANAAAEWIATSGSTSPLSLLGVLYVVEGSTNGGKFIAPILRRAWSLQEGQGLQSLDPHGARTHELWAQFRTAIDALQLSPPERASIIAAAGETFDRIGQCMDDVAALHST